MRLKLLDVYGAPHAKNEQLVPHELTPQETEHYEVQGWHHYRPEYDLPELSPVLYYSAAYCLNTERYIVVQIRDRRYKVRFCDEGTDRDEIYEATGKYLDLEPTDEAVTPPDRTPPKDGNRGYHYYKFFGQPTWVQNSHFPLDNHGNPCYHFLTIENDWGDRGNFNILIGLTEEGIPEIGYFEASCC